MARAHQDDRPPKALWGGRFREGMAPEMVPLNLCLPVDGRLWREDIRASLAWARALANAGVIGQREAAELAQGLEAVAERIEREGLADAS
ncbi:MAG: lyase family protein, partial [Gemmatimonadota bacterium]